NTLAASQQLSGGATQFVIVTPLTTAAVNNFVATATDAAGNESLAADILPITQQADTPPPPIVTDPAGPIVVNTATYTVAGSALPGTLVIIWRDNDGDGSVSTGDTQLGSQQLAAGATGFAISVSLLQNADNDLLATSTNSSTLNRSAAADVPTITHDSIPP